MSNLIDWEETISSTLAQALGSDTAPNLAESMRYSILSPGKRFRPRLMEATADLLGLSKDYYVPFAVALEWIHGFTLIHDDLPCMDDDDFRRGIPTNHKVYGEALALLAGDALVPAAIQSTFKSLNAGCPPHHWQAALSQLLTNIGPEGVIGGQALEFLLTPKSGLNDLQKMHRLKTGALFESAILIPAHLQGISPRSAEFVELQSFADAFGLAFQTADDLEDSDQDWDARSGYSSTSILAHLEFEEARSDALVKIQQSLKKLQVRWGVSSSSLGTIAAQLEEKLKSAQPPSGRALK